MKFIIRFFAWTVVSLLFVSYSAGYIPPSVSVIFSLAGLGFPYIWITVLILFPILLMTRIKWLAFISLAILGITSPVFMHHFGVQLNHEKNNLPYSIYDFNTFGLRDPDTASDQIKNQKAFHEILNKGHYSLICLQEYPMKGSKHGKFYQQLDEGLHLPYKSLSSYYWDQKFTDYILVTASRYLILDEKIFSYDSLNFAMYSDIKFPEGVIRVYNVHFQSVKLTSERKLLMINRHIDPESAFTQMVYALKKLRTAFHHREKQAKIIAESIRSSPYPVIIAGDFNDTPVSFVYRTLKRGMRDASTSRGFKRTYKYSRFPLQIDYILNSREISTGNFKVINNNLSDHFAISSGFRVDTKNN
ncbi:MAG TPA: endonuclease/exonuclease/phosphatase family protein [Lentimicrobium sp.]|nr:endonuclease/exonuclease/phosphatase family protein [Lentimicrobium sp.]